VGGREKGIVPKKEGWEDERGGAPFKDGVGKDSELSTGTV
jgi:hypothetical protein